MDAPRPEHAPAAPVTPKPAAVMQLERHVYPDRAPATGTGCPAMQGLDLACTRRIRDARNGGMLCGFHGAIHTLAHGRLPNRPTMQTICQTPMAAHCACAALFLRLDAATGGLGLPLFLLFSCPTLFAPGPTLFAPGLTFGSFNAMALHCFGTIAGAAAAVQATVNNFSGQQIAAPIGNLHDTARIPLPAGCPIVGLMALALPKVR